jgi:hypothetical protein
MVKEKIIKKYLTILDNKIYIVNEEFFDTIKTKLEALTECVRRSILL